MADKKISQLTGATTPVAGTEVLPIVQGGSTVKVAISDLTAGRSISAAGAALDGAVTINDSGANVDFRVEGDTDANMIFGDASADSVGIGTNAPNAKLHVKGASASIPPVKIESSQITGFAVLSDRYDADESLMQIGVGYSLADLVLGNGVGPSTTVSNTYISTQDTGATYGAAVSVAGGTGAVSILTGASSTTVTTGNNRTLVERASFGPTAAVINESGADVDLRVEGDTDANLLFVDASTDRIGVGTNAPQQKLHVVGNAQFTGSQVGTKIENKSDAISVTGATTILDEAGAVGRLVIVNGISSGDRFCDLVFCSTGVSPTVVSSFTSLGSPAARTYTRSGSALQLAMASGTYNVHAIAFGY
jgi:hypothetical protein